MISLADAQLVFGNKSVFDDSLKRFLAQGVDQSWLSDAREVFPPLRQTLDHAESVSGIGTFLGKEKRTLTFAPSSRPGWWIRRTDHPEQLDTAVDIANLWTSARNLVLRSGSPHNYLRMVEHIIALKAGLGLDDVLISTNSGDPPLFADSSLPLVDTVKRAGIVKSQKSASWVTVRHPVAFVGSRGDFLVFQPPEQNRRVLRLDVAISWKTVIGQQHVVFDVTPETFCHGAYARTNATHRQYQLAKTIGWLFADTRNLGYDKTNILIHGRHGYYTQPRMPLEGTEKFLEPVWHRAVLDLLAALSLFGTDRFVGTVTSYRAGHTLDCDAVRALYRQDLVMPLD